MKKLLVLASPLLAVPAFAQDASFTAAITDLTTDITSYGGSLVAVAAVGVVFMVAMKYIKKIRGAA